MGLKSKLVALFYGVLSHIMITSNTVSLAVKGLKRAADNKIPTMMDGRLLAYKIQLHNQFMITMYKQYLMY